MSTLKPKHLNKAFNILQKGPKSSWEHSYLKAVLQKVKQENF